MTGASDQEPAYFSSQILSARRFYLNLTPRVTEGLTVVSGGCERCRDDYRVQRPGLRYLSIEFVAAGHGTLTLRDQRYRLSPGHLFAYGPRIPHDIKSDPHRPLFKYFVDFVGKSGRRLMREANLSPGQLVQTSAPADILRIFENLIDAGLRKSPYCERICSALTAHLLLRSAETSLQEGSASTAAFQTYQACHCSNTEHFMTLKGLNDIANGCGVNESYLCRLFDRFDFETPYQFLIRLKMLRAAELLRNEQVLVKTVAHQLGFADQFIFSKTFTRVFSLSPKRFAKLAGRVP